MGETKKKNKKQKTDIVFKYKTAEFNNCKKSNEPILHCIDIINKTSPPTSRKKKMIIFTVSDKCLSLRNLINVNLQNLFPPKKCSLFWGPVYLSNAAT